MGKLLIRNFHQRDVIFSALREIGFTCDVLGSDLLSCGYLIESDREVVINCVNAVAPLNTTITEAE